MRSISNERKNNMKFFLLRPLFTFLKRLKSTVLREIVECISRFWRKFSNEMFFYLLHRRAKFCRSLCFFFCFFCLLSLKGVLQNRRETGRHIDARSIWGTPASDVHERLKTNCKAIKIAREATNNQ